MDPGGPLKSAGLPRCCGALLLLLGCSGAPQKPAEVAAPAAESARPGPRRLTIADQPERAAELKRRLRAMTGPSSFRAVLRPLSTDLPSDADLQRAVRSQLRSEAEPG